MCLSYLGLLNLFQVSSVIRVAIFWNEMDFFWPLADGQSVVCGSTLKLWVELLGIFLWCLDLNLLTTY